MDNNTTDDSSKSSSKTPGSHTTGHTPSPESVAKEFQSIQEQLRALPQSGSVPSGLLSEIASLTAKLGAIAGAGPSSTEVVPGGVKSSRSAVAAANGASGDNGQSASFYAQLEGIPIDYLITTPLISAARGNIALATVMTEFINTIGFDSNGNTNVLQFILDQPYQNTSLTPPSFETATITVSAPLLSLVPLPALLVQSVTVDLAVQISNVVADSTVSEATSTAGATVNASYGWGFGNASFTGTYTNTNSTTVSASQTASQAATYTINVVAEQQPPTAGMLALSQIFANCIVPVNIGSK
jgi:hypothetical protein